MKITILNVSVEDKGKYQMLDIAFKNSEGKTEGKKLVSFGNNAESFKVLKNAKAGEVYDIRAVKGDKYWEWVEAKLSTEQGESVATNTRSQAAPSRGNYETPEERAARQVYIVRQSSLSNAIEFLNHNKKNYDLGEVLNTAKILSDWVFNKGEEPSTIKTNPMADMTDDIPY